jgi:hypothetical protein
MRYTPTIGSIVEYVEHKLNRPKYCPCPKCGKKGKRKEVIERSVKHIGPLHRPSFIKAKVGVYQARCDCCKFYQAAIPGVPQGGHYTFAVREAVANSVIRDRMPYRLVIEKMLEDHCLDLSLGYVHSCFLWAHEQIDMEAHWQFVLSNFSGVLCIDEVHDSGRTILFATDPLNDFTVSFKVVEKNDQTNMDVFLQSLKDRGIEVIVAITDGSPLYKNCLQNWWQDCQHQLCIFHVFKEVNKLVLDGVRAIKNQIKRQGNKGRKRRPGRPTKKAQQQRQDKKGMTKKKQATFIWEHQYLIVKKPENLTDQDKQDLTLLLEIAPQLKLFRSFNHQFYHLFEKGISKQTARIRRTLMVNNLEYQANPFLAKALKKLRKEAFEKMITFLEWENVDCTNNHVERNNRCFRMMQKTRYKRRKTHTIEKAIELRLFDRMLKHFLYQPKHHIHLIHVPATENLSGKLAA